jgi:predicted dehydrogenase
MHDTETEDTMVGLLEWDSGCVGIADFTTASAEGFLTFDLVGTRGKLRITDGALAFEEYATDVREYLLNEDGPEFRPGCVQRIGPFPKVAGHVALYENLRDAILRGTRLIADGVSVRGSLEVANALILSSATDRAVEMPLDCAEYEEFLGRMRGQEPIQDRPAKRSNGGSQ